MAKNTAGVRFIRVFEGTASKFRAELVPDDNPASALLRCRLKLQAGSGAEDFELSQIEVRELAGILVAAGDCWSQAAAARNPLTPHPARPPD